MTTAHFRTYDRCSSVVFHKTNEPFGGLSNMAGGFPIQVNGKLIRTSEALYQACRFPHLPEVQDLIIAQKSPMTAKMVSKRYRRDSRPDWDEVRVPVMRWCLRVKLALNWETFGRLLLDTGDRPIVEYSRRDTFWSATPVDENRVIGMNMLGRLLMELREAVRTEEASSLQRVEPVAIPQFLLGGLPLGVIVARPMDLGRHVPPDRDRDDETLTPGPRQASLFDLPSTGNKHLVRGEGHRSRRRAQRSRTEHEL